MKSVLINRNGAFGDIIHMTHLPRLLKENGFDYVGVSTGYKGKQLFANNPFVDAIHFFEPGGREISKHYYFSRLKDLSSRYDKTIDLYKSIEYKALAMEDQDEYYAHQSIRDKMGEKNYYDIATEIAGFPDLVGKYKGEVFYTDEEHNIVRHDLLRPGRFADKFKVMINLAGSGPHKVFIQARSVAEKILAKYKDAVIFTTGAPNCVDIDFPDIDGVRSIVGKKNFRQALLMAKYMDCVIGCESGIMCGASMWDVPTIQLMTCASIYNHCAHSKHDYSLQSPAKCSPCFKGPYKYYGCPKKDNLPLCVYFNEEKILEKVDQIYEREYKK